MKGRNRSDRQRESAVTAELSVNGLGAQGDGIAAWRGETVFLPFTVPGDRVRARLGARRGAGHEGRVVERLAPGAGRIEPVCRHFGTCGGCALQHLDAALYRGVKLGALSGALRRAGIDPGVVAPLVSVPPARRRARFGLMRPRDPAAPAIVGFRERFSHRLVDIAECVVLEPALFALVAPLRSLAPVLLELGGAAEAMLTRGDSGIDLLIEAGAPPGLAALEALAAFAAAHDVARIVWRGGEDMLVVERRPVRVVFSGVAVALPPGGFLQASAAAEAALAAEVVAAIGDRRPVLDLYAGLGTFTFALAAFALATVAPAGGGAVHAVEGDAAAVAGLTQAAAGMPRVSVKRRDLDRDPLSVAELAPYAAAVFDPPRAGAARQAAQLAQAALDTVVAVSCNPATFARDAALLVAGGFRLERVVPVDQFTWTPHLELVGVFRR